MCFNILCCESNHEARLGAVPVFETLRVWHWVAMTRAMAIVLALICAMAAEARAHAGHAGSPVQANDSPRGAATRVP
jgi:hypothetical protein